MGNLKWDHVPFTWVNTKPPVRFRKANTDPSTAFLERPIWKRPCILGGEIQDSFLAKCEARISINLSAHLSHSQTSSGKNLSVRMHSVKAYVIPHDSVTLQKCNTNWSVQHFERIINSAICSAIWRWKVKAPYGSASSRY